MAKRPPRNRTGTTGYSAIADELRGLIVSGELTPGQQLPTEHALCQQFGVARDTVRRAVGVLINEGLVVSLPKVGTFVRVYHQMRWQMVTRDSVRARKIHVVDPWLAAVRDAQFEGHQTIRVELVPAETQVTEAATVGELITLGPSGLAVVRRRVRSIARDGLLVPQELADSYFDFDTVKDTAIMSAEDIQPSVFEILDGLGHVRSGFEDRASCRMPTHAETEALALPPVTPVLELIRISMFTPERVRLHFRHTRYGPGNELVWEVEA